MEMNIYMSSDGPYIILQKKVPCPSHEVEVAKKEQRAPMWGIVWVPNSFVEAELSTDGNPAFNEPVPGIYDVDCMNFNVDLCSPVTRI